MRYFFEGGDCGIEEEFGDVLTEGDAPIGGLGKQALLVCGGDAGGDDFASNLVHGRRLPWTKKWRNLQKRSRVG
jgi:hypothetical protein